MRTINDIIPPSRRREEETLTNQTPRTPQSPKQRSRFPYRMLTTMVLIIIGSFGALYYFSDSKIEITPNTVSVAVQNSFTATHSAGDLPYEIITSQKIASQSVKSNGTETVHSSATGSITIYNTQTKNQKLIANTRFATTAGLVFRIHDSVTIPAGNVTNPGTLVVKVYADKEGDAYNVGPTSFTVPGFAGTPQETQVYARSSEAMSGGASGTVPVVDSSLEKTTREALATALAPELMASLQELIPSGYVLIQDSATTSFQKLAASVSTNADTVEIKEQGTITAVVFPNIALAKSVANSVPGLSYQGEPVSIVSPGTLKFSSVHGLPGPEDASYTFTLSGNAQLVYMVDATRIAAAVSGKTRGAAEVALTNYPEVKRAILTLRPFWRQNFPEDPSTITVTVLKP